MKRKRLQGKKKIDMGDKREESAYLKEIPSSAAVEGEEEEEEKKEEEKGRKRRKNGNKILEK